MEYPMKLHENKTLFRQGVQFTADQMKIAAGYIEKDYWVTHVLQTIFAASVGEDTIFKGGTALSKCYQIIDRFSEDIDLVVLRREGESNNRLTNKIKTISEVVNAVLPEVMIEGLTRKKGMNRKTAHNYSKEFDGSFGQVRDVIIVEATWFGYYEPFTTQRLNSFVGEMMLETGQEKLAEQYEMMPFEVRVLGPTRTICEKIMSLVRFSYTENPLVDLRNKIRHCYDLHQLLQQEEFAEFFVSDEFTEMLLKVANDDVVSFRNNNQWLIYHPNESLIFRDIDSIWQELKATYNGDFRNLVYGELPNGEAVAETLKKIKERLAKIKWTIKISESITSLAENIG
jgi:Nucleotidyl transferase AbiEii toxin, Type IV TA system